MMIAIYVFLYLLVGVIVGGAYAALVAEMEYSDYDAFMDDVAANSTLLIFMVAVALAWPLTLLTAIFYGALVIIGDWITKFYNKRFNS